MANNQMTHGIVAGRLPKEAIDRNFADLHPPLDAHEAAVAADRCYFCHDAPCMTACPTTIDIPLFIRQIQTGTPEQIYRLCRTAIEKGKRAPGGFILGPGCGLPVAAPPVNVYAMTRAAHDFGWYAK